MPPKNKPAVIQPGLTKLHALVKEIVFFKPDIEALAALFIREDQVNRSIPHPNFGPPRTLHQTHPCIFLRLLLIKSYPLYPKPTNF